MKVEEQLVKLVSIPSFVDKTNNEKMLGEYLLERLYEIYPTLPAVKQYVTKERFNVYVKQESPKLFVIGHIDTVQPSSNWKTDPFRPLIRDGNLYGLGAWDMKGSLAAFLTALENVKKEIDLTKLSMLFYVDEEYDFLGMKKFVEKKPVLKPKLVLSLDGTEKLRSGCRGLIELDLEIIGKSGHSSKPFNGVNAITSTTEIVKTLEKEMMNITNKELGYCTVNLAYLQGGKISKSKNQIEWKREGNVIPDYTDCTIEIRTTDKKVDAASIISKLKEISRSVGVKINVKRTRHNIIPWKCANREAVTEEIKEIYKQCSLSFSLEDIQFSGYVDIGMLEGVITAPKYTIGVSGDNAHAPNEYAIIKSLYNAQKIYEKILKKYCQVEIL